jgi:hypothetical protein
MVAEMNRALALLLAALALLLPGGGAFAQSGARVVSSVSWVEEWDPASGQWVRVDDAPASFTAAAFETKTTTARTGNAIITETIVEEPVRFIARAPRWAGAGQGVAQYGPFRVLDDRRAALVGTTDAASPQAFAAMLAAHPGLEVIEFADAPGTSNDIANLKLGRAIRAAGLATHVPQGGSARSGAVELFLAGTRRTMDPRALFAVHSWRDEVGREPGDFAADAPENRLYLDYYAEMGMTAEEARAFYAMTNSVPHAGALWLEGTEMARWIAPEARSPATRMLSPKLASGQRFALARSDWVAKASFSKLRTSEHGILSAPKDALTPAPLAPKLAYADLGAGLLDSLLAFP